MPKYRVIEEYCVEVTNARAIDIIAKTRRQAQEFYYDNGDDAGMIVYDKEIKRSNAFDSNVVGIDEVEDA